MYHRYHGGFGDSDDDLDNYDEIDNLYRRPFARQNQKENKFLKIVQSVIEEENKFIGLTQEDEEMLFSKINLHLMKPFIPLGIFTLQRLAFIPSTVSAERLNEMANIICINVFNPLTDTDEDISVYADFCKAFAYLKATSHERISVTFEQILIKAFIDELSKKLDYEQRLERLLWHRDIPHEKKEKWLKKQIEEQRRVFKIIIHKSVRFLDKLFQLFPEIVYRVLEFLLKSQGADRFQYLCALVDTVRFHGITYRGNNHVRDDAFEADVTDIYQMKIYYWEKNQQRFPARPVPAGNKTLTHLFESINMLSHTDYNLSPQIRDAIQNRIIEGHDKKEISPQDYIKYCVKDCLLLERLKPEDDFEIDDEDGYDCELYTLRSKNWSPRTIGNSRPHGAVFWRGLRVKIVTKKTENKPVQREIFDNRLPLKKIF